MFRYTLEKDEFVQLTRQICREIQAPHTHEFIEIVYIIDGSGSQTVNSDTYPVKRGDLLFINFKEVHAFSSEHHMEYINCLVSPEFLNRELVNSENALDLLTLGIFKDFYDMNRGICPHISFHGMEMLEIEALLNDMLRESVRKAPGYMTILNSYVNVLLTKYSGFSKPGTFLRDKRTGPDHAGGIEVYRGQL
jgi:AraC-like ligand binding domain.